MATASVDVYAGAVHSESARRVLEVGRVLPAGRTSVELLDELARMLTGCELRWSSPGHGGRFADMFVEAVQAGRVTVGTPALTNVWAKGRPFASCAAVPADPGQGASVGAREATATAEGYYLDNMGSGWNLDGFADPIGTLIELNDHAAAVEQSGVCERYVGNLAHLSADHPRIRDFVGLKVTRPLPHFNLSVNLGAEDISGLLSGQPAVVRLVEEMAEAAWRCGDPGAICLGRFNAHNPLRGESPYVTTAPCAEVGLAPGDTCLFGYVNLAAFARSPHLRDYDLDGLRGTVALAVRALDDLLDAGEHAFAHPLSRDLAAAKRRIGISVCGYADLLVWAGIPYGSPPALELLEDLLSVVHYEAVAASVALARQRGPFGAFWASSWADDTRMPPPATRWVDEESWAQLYRSARIGGLRHSSLTALAPSGRSAILLGVNPSIEPFLTDPRTTTSLNPALRRQASTQPDEVVRTATEIDWRAHLDTVRTAARLVDESVSKTVNLPVSATPDDVKTVFVEALRAGLKAISVYRPHP